MSVTPLMTLSVQRIRLKRALSKFHDTLFGQRRKYLRYYASEQWNSRRGAMEWLSVRFHYALDRVSGRVPPKSGDAYLTHMPVLLALGRSLEVKRVLELGCGRFSTLTFMDRDHFPVLERLDSVENDKDWAAQVVALSGDDGRLNMHVVEGAVAESLSGFDLDTYDLIFIDDALTRDERVRTIRTVGAALPKHAIVVIHDYDMLVYRKAARCFRHRYRFTALYPNTGIAWNEPRFQPDRIETVDRWLHQARRDGRVPGDPDEAAAYFKTGVGDAIAG